MTDNNFKNLATTPRNCHLWHQKHPKPELETVKRYTDMYSAYGDDRNLQLKRCPDCGQLYLYEMVEFIDTKGGNDPQYRTYIPVTSEHMADKLCTRPELEISRHTPQIRNDFLSDGTRRNGWWR